MRGMLLPGGMAAMGVAPTSLKVLRSQAAGAVINKGGRCTTSAVAVGLPQGADPAAAVREAILLQWIGIWQDSDAGQRQRIRKAWPRQLSKLVRADRWRIVYGPMRAYICTMLDVGWRPAAPDIVFDHMGKAW